MNFKPFVGNGNGNTFLVVSQEFCYKNPAHTLLELWHANKVDSLLILAPTPSGDVCMYVPGRDGIFGKESGTFCGNGSRLVAKFFFKMTGRHPVIVNRDGDRFPTYVSNREIQVQFPLPSIYEEVVLAGGEPHQMIGHFHSISDLIRFCNNRNQRVSANLMEVKAPNHLRVKTFEHSINRFTASCGTGAISMAYLSYLKGLSDRKVTISGQGGSLQIEMLNRNLIMAGPAKIDYQILHD